MFNFKEIIIKIAQINDRIVDSDMQTFSNFHK